jgi:hypothetical protein
VFYSLNNMLQKLIHGFIEKILSIPLIL